MVCQPQTGTEMKELLLKMVALSITIILVVVVKEFILPEVIILWNAFSYQALQDSLEPYKWWFLIPILLFPIFYK
jgi:hypothetical protein